MALTERGAATGPRELAELSAKATPGMISLNPTNRLRVRTSMDHPMCDFSEPYHRQFKGGEGKDPEFMIALWNAYRAGELIFATPSESAMLDHDLVITEAMHLLGAREGETILELAHRITSDKNWLRAQRDVAEEKLATRSAIGASTEKDAARYRALRDSGIAVSAWQDIDGVHWAVNGTEYMNLDDGADALLGRKK